MKRAPIVVAAAALLALGACGGGGGKKAVTSAGDTPASTALAPPTTEATGDTATTAASAAVTTGSPAGASAAPAGTPATTAKAVTQANPATTPTPAQNPAGPSSSASAGPTYTGKPTTPPGKYHYAISGTSSFGSPPPGADVVVDAPQGSTQHSQLTSGSDQNSSTTDTTLGYQADGVHLVDLTTKSAAGTLQFHPNPAPLIFPASFAKGATVGPFDMTSTDGKEKATVRVTIQDVGVAVVTGDKSSHPTIQAEVDTTLACTNPADPQCLSGTLNSTRWLGYDGVQIKSHDTTDATFGAYKFTSDTTSLADKASPS